MDEQERRKPAAQTSGKEYREENAPEFMLRGRVPTERTVRPLRRFQGAIVMVYVRTPKIIRLIERDTICTDVEGW